MTCSASSISESSDHHSPKGSMDVVGGIGRCGSMQPGQSRYSPGGPSRDRNPRGAPRMGCVWCEVFGKRRGPAPRSAIVSAGATYVVEMPVQGEEAAPRLVRPDLDLVIIATYVFLPLEDSSRDSLDAEQTRQEEQGPRVARLDTTYRRQTRADWGGKRRLGQDHRALRTCQSGCPCGNPRAGSWRSGGTRGSMAWSEIISGLVRVCEMAGSFEC